MAYNTTFLLTLMVVATALLFQCAAGQEFVYVGRINLRNRMQCWTTDAVVIRTTCGNYPVPPVSLSPSRTTNAHIDVNIDKTTVDNLQNLACTATATFPTVPTVGPCTLLNSSPFHSTQGKAIGIAGTNIKLYNIDITAGNPITTVVMRFTIWYA